MDVALDSGAFSIDSGKASNLTIEEYAEYLKRSGDRYSMRFTFDKIMDGKRSYQNWLWLRKQGLDVVPVYHIGTPEKYLVRYLKQTDFISTGGVAAMHRNLLHKDMRYIWEKYLTDKKGQPLCKVHGLGITSARIMYAFPWYSVDSTSALLLGANGKAYLPLRLFEKDGRLEEDLARMWAIASFATRKGIPSKIGGQDKFFSWPQDLQERYERYLSQYGVRVGEQSKEDIESYKTPLLEMGNLPEPDTQEGEGIVLTGHWTNRAAWNLILMDLWSKKMNGPKVYFASDTMLGVMIEYGLMDRGLLVSFARKEEALDKMWERINEHDIQERPASTARRRMRRTR